MRTYMMLSNNKKKIGEILNIKKTNIKNLEPSNWI